MVLRQTQDKKIFWFFSLTIFFWSCWLFLIFNFPPSSLVFISAFFFLLFLSLFLTCSLIFKQRGLAFLISLGMIILLFLQMEKFLNWLNGGILIIILFLLKSYFGKSREM